MIKEIYNPNTEENFELHKKKQDGSLLQWREEYRKTHAEKFYNIYNNKAIAEIFCCMCEDMNISIQKEADFVYFLDFVYLLDKVTGHCFGNLTPNYRTLLEFGISQLYYIDESEKFCKDSNLIFSGMECLVHRIINKLEGQENIDNANKIEWFNRLLDKPAEHFDEAIQRVLFTNQIMWQSNHYLVGLGDLDFLLYPYYEKDISSGYLSKDEARKLLKSLLEILHQYYWLKSSMLMGDTGQVIVLGKSDIEGEYQYNELTEMFIDLIQELQMPDPKLLLRVNKNTPVKIFEKALLCIATGVGSPILSNDDIIIPALVEFGVPKNDAINYMVAACWEPLIGGKSSSLNNMTTLNYMRALENLFKREDLRRIKSFDDLLETYYMYLGRNLNAVKRVVYAAKFQYDPVLSVFIDGCRRNKTDVSDGGAEYMNPGITSVALGNVVDSLLNIKEYVFEKKEMSLIDVKKIILTNFEEQDTLLETLKQRKSQYGNDNAESIELSKKIMEVTTENTIDFRTELGGKLKFGLSAPTYIDAAKEALASFDGRKKGEPFRVHISNETAESYTQILNFAAMLDYKENRFNGNVIDFMVTPDFIQNNLEKFIILLRIAITKGIFQMQMNVINSEILLEAKKYPERFPNLIVRVWGFSSFYNDLPDEYKDVLIERALKNEGK